jgi:hypothetical protein
MTRFGVAVSVAAVVLSLTAGAALAGEITGNGKILKTDSSHWGGDLNGRSYCAFSGQEDLQYTDPPQSDAHAQSWGQIQFPGLTRQETRAILTEAGANPGISCNPTSGFVLPE